MFDEGSDEYKIIMLNKRYLSFRVIKVSAAIKCCKRQKLFVFFFVIYNSKVYFTEICR